MFKKYYFALFAIILALLGCHGKKDCGGTSNRPDMPVNVSVSSGDRFLDISWDAVGNADGYIVYIGDTGKNIAQSFAVSGISAAVATKSGITTAEVVTVKSNFYRASNLINGRDYIVRIASKHSRGHSTLTKTVHGVPRAPLTVPAKPAVLNANPGDARVELAWSMVPGAESYHLYQSLSGVGNFVLVRNSSSPSYIVTGLTNGTAYDFIVKASNKIGEGEASDIATATPVLPTAPPTTPFDLTPTAGDGYVSLQWTLVQGAESYQIFVSESEAGPYVVKSTTGVSPFKVSGLVNGQTYFFKIAGVNVAGVGTPSEPAVSGTPNVPITAPGAINGLGATGGDARVDLLWDISPDATGYKVYISETDDDHFVFHGNSGSGSYAVTGLSNDKTYRFRVSAINNAGEGSQGSTVVALTKAQTSVLQPPASVNVLGGNGSATVSWDNVSGATNYTIYQSTSPSGPFTAVVAVTSSPYIVPWLINGQIYYFALGANNSAGNGQMSSPVAVIPNVPMTVPPVPSGLSANGGNASVAVSWNASEGAISYNIYQSDTEMGTYMQVRNSTSTSDNITGLTNAQAYWFKVTALNDAGESEKSAVAQTTPQAPIVLPSAPSGVNSAPGNASVSVSWETAQGADIYNIYQSNTETGTYTNIASSNLSPFQVIGLANGTTYWFKVSAQNSAGEGTQSIAVSATPMTPVVPPSAPVWLSIVAGDGYADFTWSEPIGATGYNIYQSDSEVGAYSRVASPSVSNIRINGLTNGQTYWFKVSAANTAGEGAQSNATSTMPKSPVVAPVAPAGLNAVAGDTQVNLTWSAVTEADTYVVYESSDNIIFAIAQTTVSTNVTVHGLTNDQTYYFKVTGQNSAGEGADSSVVSTTPKAPVTPPPAPLISSAVPGNASVNLGWSPVLGAVNYIVYISSDGGLTYTKHSDSPDTLEFVTGLTNGTTYFFQITAVNSSDMESVRSQSLSATPVAPILKPTTPLGLLAVSGDRSVNLTWTASIGASTYNVYQSTTQNDGYTQIATRNITAHTTENLTNGTTYWFKVSAVNSAGESDLSEAVPGNPFTPIIIPSIPTGLVATPSDSTVSLSWNTVLDATGYNVYSTNAAGSSYTLITTVASASYTATGLINGTTYYFVVSAVNLAGESVKSVIATARPLSSVIPAPGNVKASSGLLGILGVRITWDPVTWNGGVSKADGYFIYMSLTGQNGAYSEIGKVGPNVISFDRTGLTLLSTYWFKIKAKNGGDLSDFSEAVSATVILGL